MAFKIYKKNNYIIIEDTVAGKQYQGLAKNVFVYKDTLSETTYDFEGLTYNGLKGIVLADLLDENNTAFVDEQAFIDFYTENTGNFNSGGASSLPTDVQDALLGADSPSTSNPFVTKNNLDEKADKSRTSIILKNNFTPNTLTSNVLTETIVDNYDLGVGFLNVGESLVLNAELIKINTTSGSAWSYFYLSKVANSISVTDAVKIATVSPAGVGNGSTYVERIFHRKSTSILSGRVIGTTAQITDKLAINNVPIDLINDANLSNYRYLIVASTFTGTGGGFPMQTNIILTKNPVV